MIGIFFGASINSQDMSTRVMQPIFLIDLLEKLKQGENIIFTKYGDGEYECMRGTSGCNIDKDSYHPWLGDALKKALVSLSQKKNAYIGKWWWWAPEVSNFCDTVAADGNVTVPWVGYHVFMNDDEFLKYDYMYQFVDFLIHTDRKKIVICNRMNSKLTALIRAHTYIEIPEKNWSYEYQHWKSELCKHIEKDSIILISGGLCSKVLIDDITNEYNVTFIDLGSSFDLLTRRINTRGWKHTYQQEIDYYRCLLPKSWI